MDRFAETPTPGSDESAVAKRERSRPTAAGTERNFAEILADVVRVDQVSVDSHYFDDLGANSLVMAQFCARVRKRPDLPSVSMKDIYRYPTIRSLVAAVVDSALTSEAALAAQPETPPEVVTRASTLRYTLCGALQLLVFLGYSFISGAIAARGYTWVHSGSGALNIYLRAVVFGGVGFVFLCAFPVVAKWILIGRWKEREFPIWGLTFLRFWTVKALVHANPMVFLVGNPLYPLYLRALGARVGKGVTILSHHVPVCTDLLTIGAGTVIRKEAYFLCYRAQAGRIQTGRVTLGRDVYIGEKSVLDIGTSMGDGAQLGHSSALHSGQSVPASERFHGSPAERTDVDYLRVAPAECGTLRRTVYAFAALLQLFLVYLPLAVGGLYMLLQISAVRNLLGPGTVWLAGPKLYQEALYLSLALFFGFVVVGLGAQFVVPRLLGLLIRPDTVYPLYGMRYSVHRAVMRLSNIKFFPWLFGDSSYIVTYLRGLGYDLSHVEQTGSNFGTLVQHETPYLCSVGRGTMVADGLSIINADYSSTSFRVSRASIGAFNFLGNNIAFPAGARTGENCLLATKVMVPLDGEVREGVGLLGSPPFEIPRSVERDSHFDHFRTGEEFSSRLARKNRYNLRSMALWLLVRWLHVFVLTVLSLATLDLYDGLGPLVLAAYPALTVAFTCLYLILVERCISRFRSLRPQLCSIYDPYFWWHERLWKVPDHYLKILNGTPYKTMVWRLLGMRIGRRVYDDGCAITERTLSTVGDDSTLNPGSKIQCHSQEDGTFKSDRSTIGSGCTLGVAAHIHYGVTVGDGAIIAADSFLMKGEEVPPHARWGGNPATDLRQAGHRAAALTRHG
ncbi:Pls/PosA family non-ribosomal peptide synthetase [Streptomyces sp. CdTB01]|uniref:Pls/PosA family non-ribosomal peptide synthetase n=1 Tax=Streptomyces sp. CdTB01 TaxID=1725411 RepID=UPI00073A79CD|nr:peptide synthetase [Streptomyces sp. CdTB01]